MATKAQVSPGTVSRILWHFTGGPVWNAKTKKQEAARKPPADAYDNLKSILKSKVLRLGSYREVLKVVLPKHRKVDPTTRKLVTRRNVPVTLESSSICCLSDIPAPHLRYHAYRYGSFAIGFHRHAVIRAGFNPVFYTLHDTPVVRSIYQGFSSLNLAGTETIRYATDEIDTAVSNCIDEHEGIDLDVSGEISDLQYEADSLQDTLEAASRASRTSSLS